MTLNESFKQWIPMTSMPDDSDVSVLPMTGGSVKESIFFFAKDVAPRWASNPGPFHGNYKDKYTSP